MLLAMSRRLGLVLGVFVLLWAVSALFLWLDQLWVIAPLQASAPPLSATVQMIAIVSACEAAALCAVVFIAARSEAHKG